MGLYEAAKDAFVLAQKSNDAELIQKIIEVQKDALDMQEKQQLQQARIGDLEDRIRDLQDQLRQKEEVVFEKGVYWMLSDTQRDQPYCSVCYAKGRIVPLQPCWDGRSKDRTPWKCPDKTCGASYNPWNHKEETHVYRPSGGSHWPQQY